MVYPCAFVSSLMTIPFRELPRSGITESEENNIHIYYIYNILNLKA